MKKLLFPSCSNVGTLWCGIHQVWRVQCVVAEACYNCCLLPPCRSMLYLCWSLPYVSCQDRPAKVCCLLQGCIHYRGFFLFLNKSESGAAASPSRFFASEASCSVHPRPWWKSKPRNMAKCVEEWDKQTDHWVLHWRFGAVGKSNQFWCSQPWPSKNTT
jgi:hypothetical protein